MLNKLLVMAKVVIERFPRIAALYRGVRDQLDGMQEAQLTPWGFKLAGNAIMAQGEFEPVETKLVRELLKDVDVLVNVGANVGYYCCHALSMGKEVIAFEPIVRNYRYLCQNIKVNNWSCEVFPIALSNKIGVLEIYGGDTGASILKGWAGAPESYMTLIPSSTLDMVLGSRLCGKNVMVLVDVEGAEYWMLEGALIMLGANPKPIWFIEITTEEHQPVGVGINPNFKNIFALFFQHGYQAFNVDEELKPITMDQIDLVMQGKSKFNAHNFLFKSCDYS